MPPAYTKKIIMHFTRICKTETFESGGQSGDLKNRDNERTCFLVWTQIHKISACGSAHCHVIWVGKMDDEVVTILLVFISSLLAVY